MSCTAEGVSSTQGCEFENARCLHDEGVTEVSTPIVKQLHSKAKCPETEPTLPEVSSTKCTKVGTGETGLPVAL